MKIELLWMDQGEFSQYSRLTGHKGGVLCCAFSKTGTYLLSGSQDRSIGLWNFENGRLITRFDGHGQAVRDVQCSNDSATLIR